MDLQTRKIQFIQRVLRIQNENILEKLEKLLHQEREKLIEKDLEPMSIEEFNSLVDAAEEDDKNGQLYNAVGILNDIDRWK